MRRLFSISSKKSKMKVPSPEQPSVFHTLTRRQASINLSTFSASAEPATTDAHGLQVVAEGTNPTIEYASCCPVARSQLTQL
jgi:hypothetical protein